MPHLSEKDWIFSGEPDVSVIPTISNPSFLYFSANLIKSGISRRQGPHQVPQKLSKTTFPFNSLNETQFPSRSAKVKSGAINA